MKLSTAAAITLLVGMLTHADYSVSSTITVSSMTESSFRASTATSTAYHLLQVGDSLHPASIGSGAVPELLGGVDSNTLTTSAQFDWPTNWIQSYLMVSYTASTRDFSLSIRSGDPNGRPAAASISVVVGDEFDELYFGGTALINALYAHPIQLSEYTLPSLSPNGYGYGSTAHFSGYRIGGSALQSDFNLSGAIYFDGGTQSGSTNRLEFGLGQSLQVPEPNSILLVVTAILVLLLCRFRKAT